VPTHELVGKGISYVPQGRQIFSDMTVKENLEMGAYIINDNELVKNLIEKIFTKLPFLEKKKNEYAFTLSGGQQQLLSFGRALILEPKLMLLDEPFLGLSPLMVKEIVNEIKKINRRGIAILMVEHNTKIVSDIADKIYVVKDGNMVLYKN
jgi:branched-chain amino acid transport system ATP-binding protein